MMTDMMTILKRELRRVFTDRRLMFTTFLLPALSLVLIYSAMGLMAKNMAQDRNAHIGQVVVINGSATFAEYAITHHLEASYHFINRTSAQLEASKEDVYEGSMDALVVFDKDFDVSISNYQDGHVLPNVLTYYNPSEDYSKDVHEDLITKVLNDYERQLLIKRFGQASYLRAFTVDANNNAQQLAPKERIAGSILGGLVPMLLSIFLFSGAMGIGIDLITGEKERGTMATMLVTPVKRETIAFAKMLSLSIVALLSTASSLVGMAISFPFLGMIFSGGEDISTGVKGASRLLTLSPVGVFQFVCLAIVLTLIYVGIICIISVYANAIKEAGSLMTPAYMMVMLLGAGTVFASSAPKAWVFAIPLYGTLMGMRVALSGRLSWWAFTSNFGMSLLLVVGIVFVIRHMFNSEKIMFGA